MVVPRVFSNERERVIASFNFIELASGEGFVKFNGFNSKDDTTKDYHMSVNAVFSSDIVTTADVTAGIQKVMDLDFDSLFAKPQNLKGIAIINIPYGTQGTGSNSCYCLVKIFHVAVGGAETLLGSEQKTETLNSVGAGSLRANAKVECLRFDIGSQHFKAGETLRVNVEFWGGATAGSIKHALGHDPANRTVDVFTETTRTSGGQETASSKLDIYIPFRIDL